MGMHPLMTCRAATLRGGGQVAQGSAYPSEAGFQRRERDVRKWHLAAARLFKGYARVARDFAQQARPTREIDRWHPFPFHYPTPFRPPRASCGAPRTGPTPDWFGGLQAVGSPFRMLPLGLPTEGKRLAAKALSAWIYWWAQ